MTQTDTMTDQGTQGGSPATALQASIHQTQYDDTTASFFEKFNTYTGRPELYFGYLAGRLAGKAAASNGSSSEAKTAVDFGCGTGWLTPRLSELGFKHAIGIIHLFPCLPSPIAEQPKSSMTNGRVCYKKDIPDYLHATGNAVL